MSNRPRLLVISNRYPGSSKPYAGHYVAGHVARHRAAGFEVAVLHPRLRGAGRSGLRSYAAMAPDWLAHLRRRQADLVHAHWSAPAGLLAAIWAARHGRPLLVTEHGAFARGPGRRPALGRWLAPWVWRRADQVIGVGQQQVDQIQRMVGSSDKRVHLIPMGIDVPPVPGGRPHARRQLGLAAEERLLLFAGNLEHNKGPDLFLAAVEHLLPRHPALKAIVVGQGPMLPALRQQCLAAGIERAVQFSGGVAPATAHTYMRAADICVAPSRAESFGLVALEAMACGALVVAAKVGGLATTVQDGVNGYSFPAEDHVALGALLDDLLRRLEGEIERIARARETAAEHGIDRYAAQVEAIYRALLAGAA